MGGEERKPEGWGHLENLRVILKSIFKKYDLMEWNILIWVRIKTSDERL